MLITQLRARRVATAAALAGGAAIVLAGCTTGGGDNGSGDSNGGTITVAQVNAATSLNSGTPGGNLNTNGMLTYLTGPVAGSASSLGGFYTLDQEFNVVPNPDIGTFEEISEDPLTVKYTIKDGAKWSDGEPITADDLYLGWAIGSGYYDDATTDDEGNAVSGTSYFSLAGSTDGLDTTEKPEIGDDNMSATITYGTPYVDWSSTAILDKPAHVVAEKAGVSTEELIKTLKDLPKGDPENPAEANETLKAAAEFWNTGYDFTSMPTDKSLLVSSGPFIVSAFTADQSITLTKNPEYVGAYTPKYDELVIRFIGDANAQITALQNGEVDVIQPQPSADTLKALEAANLDPIEGSELAYDHLDLNFDSDVFKDAKVREAFLKTVPRQQILDSIITPVNPSAEVLNSQIFVPDNPEYTDATAVNGYSAWEKPDIEGAKELLDGATPTVRILYNTENPNRVDSFKAIQSSAAEAGITVEDAGSPDWGSLLPGGDYDASIYGWVSPGIGSTALPQIFGAGGGGNYNNYNNSEVNEWVKQSQVELDESKLADLKIKIDTATAKDFYGLPLFQTPGLYAVGGAVQGVEFFAGQTGVVWNAQDWTVAE